MNLFQFTHVITNSVMLVMLIYLIYMNSRITSIILFKKLPKLKESEVKVSAIPLYFAMALTNSLCALSIYTFVNLVNYA